MGRRKNILSGKSGVYEILNTITGKRYIGSSNQLSIRVNQHKSDLKNGRHCNTHLQRSCNKYGYSVFHFNIIEFCDSSLIVEREQFWIDSYNFRQIYNARPVAHHNSGFKWTDEQKEKLVGMPPRNVKEPIKKNCSNCSKEFYVVPSRMTTAMHCSQKCYWMDKLGKPNNSNTKFKAGIKTWNKGTKGIMKANVTSFKSTVKFQFVSPGMILYEGVGLEGFAREMNLTAIHLGNVIRKKSHTHKGWRLPKEGDIYNGIGLWLDAA